jgi:hypothetical protein
VELAMLETGYNYIVTYRVKLRFRKYFYERKSLLLIFLSTNPLVKNTTHHAAQETDQS